jgi:hypothetical protein
MEKKVAEMYMDISIKFSLLLINIHIEEKNLNNSKFTLIYENKFY